MRYSKIIGMRDLQRSIKRLGKVPQKYVTQAVKSGSMIAKRAAKKEAPYETGELQSAIIVSGEKTKIKGKKVYDIRLDPSKNDVFQKKSKTTTINRMYSSSSRKKKQNKIAYYPASQEYGFVAKNGRYIPGFHYLEKALTMNADAIESKIVNYMGKKIEQELKKGG